MDARDRLFQPGKTSAAQALCPRLVDYIAIVGRRPNAAVRRRRAPNSGGQNGAGATAGPTAGPGGAVSHPELLRRYPSENHRDFELPKDVAYFCQPEGCISFSGSAYRQLKRRHAFRDASAFVFTLTDKDSAKVRFGVTLNFFQNSGAIVERRQLVSNGTAANSSDSRPSSSHSHSASASLVSLCLMSHHPFLSSFRDLLLLFRQLVDCCNHRANQEEHLPRDAVWTALTGHWPAGMSVPTPVMQELRQLETWLFSLLSSPVPVPGKTKLLLEVLPADLMPAAMEFALPDHTRLSLVDFPLHLPLELLGVDTVLQLLAAIMLEYKVILQSRNFNAVSVCVLALVALLYPLEYMFPVIPLLPVFMPSAEQLLLAPTPYIIGVPASFFACKGIQVPSDVLLVDLDTNELTLPSDPTIQIPQFPQPDANILKEEFLHALGRQREQHNENSDGQIATDADQIDVAARVAMIHFYNGPNVFANFSEHTRTIRLYPRPVVALQTESFLRSRPHQSEFITELCRTQAVEYFAECSLCPANEAYVRVQAGVTSALQIGDKARWFADQLMPVSFNAYPYGSSLSEAIFLARIDSSHAMLERVSDSGDDESEYPTTATPSDLESVGSADAGGWSPFGSRTGLNFDVSKPISDVNDVYRAPQRLQLPQSESALSIDSSDMSSARSSPCSAVDSEADFARLADNLALKRNARGDYTFDHQEEDEDSATMCESGGSGTGPRGSVVEETALDSTRVPKSGKPGAGGGGGIFARPQLMDALNGYAERGHGVFSQMMKRTVPKAQALKEKARPLADKMEASKVGQLIQQHRPHKSAAPPEPRELERLEQERERDSAAAAQQQRRNQQQIVEVCEQVLAGQGVGVFTLPKVRRLLEDESMRALVCAKLNLGLEVRYAEDECIQEVQLSRAQYKGYIKLLQACVSGLETSFQTPGSNGLASLFHVLEIAHTHFWTELDAQGATTPGATQQSLRGSPSSGSIPTPQPSATGSSSNGTTTPSPAKQAPPKREDGPPKSPPPPFPPPPPPMASAVYSIPIANPPAAPPPPLPARPPPLPPRLPSRDGEAVARPVGVPPSVPPPPLPKRPDSIAEEKHGDGQKKNALVGTEEKENDVPSSVAPPTVEAPSLEIPVQDVALGETAKNGVHHQSPPKPRTPQQLNLGALEQMLPGASAEAALPARHFIADPLVGSAAPTNATAAAAVLWQKMAFWETAFLDMVAQERDKIGMDQEPAEMIDRYAQLGDGERKRLELDEDRILAVLLHNMTAMMQLCHVPVRVIQQKIRRMLGKAHIGLVYSKRINQLLDELASLPAGVKIPLKPLGSRLIQKEVFAVHEGASSDGQMCFLEVCDDALIVRAVSGLVQERWWYERLVNMTYSPKTRVLCVWRRHEDQVHMHKFHTKKCRHLYNSVKAAMERAASRGKVQVAGRELGGEFPIHDVERNEGGLLQVRIDGIALQFVSSQELIELGNIKKCNTVGGNIFILEEFNRSKGQLIQRRYISAVAPCIVWSLHRVFSIHQALSECAPAQRAHLDESQVTLYRSPCDPMESRAILPVRAPSCEQQEALMSRSFASGDVPSSSSALSSSTWTQDVEPARARSATLCAEALAPDVKIHREPKFKGPILLPMT